eukprot:scaffold86711_cov66-Phaeocystis_antarctica.AAC.2
MRAAASFSPRRYFNSLGRLAGMPSPRAQGCYCATDERCATLDHERQPALPTPIFKQLTTFSRAHDRRPVVLPLAVVPVVVGQDVPQEVVPDVAGAFAAGRVVAAPQRGIRRQPVLKVCHLRSGQHAPVVGQRPAQLEHRRVSVRVKQPLRERAAVSVLALAQLWQLTQRLRARTRQHVRRRARVAEQRVLTQHLLGDHPLQVDDVVSRALEQRQSRRRAGDCASMRRPPTVEAANKARQD